MQGKLRSFGTAQQGVAVGALRLIAGF